jgi:mRNA interferase MazF
VISPDEMNDAIRTVIIAPMTTKSRSYPSRVPCTFQRKTGQIALDQIRTVDRSRLVKKLGRLDGEPSRLALVALQEMFAF